jgi:hypothetical protein
LALYGPAVVDGLDEVAWDRLNHAYGPGVDVPGLLRGVVEGDADALGDLRTTIWHQGTVYEATAYAVPFLIEVLDAPGSDKAGVLRLLSAITHGRSYADVHQRYDVRRDTEEFKARIAVELSWVRAARPRRCARAPRTCSARSTLRRPDSTIRLAWYGRPPCSRPRRSTMDSMTRNRCRVWPPRYAHPPSRDRRR